MAKEEKNSTKVVIKPKGGVLATFVHLDQVDEYNDKYSITLLIPKDDKATMKAIKSAIDTAMAQGEETKFKGKNIKKAQNPIKDGDDEDTEKFPHYADKWVVQFKTTQKPKVINTSRQAISGSEEVYPGMFVMVSGFFMPYNEQGNFGVTGILGDVVKVADGDRLGSGAGFDLDDDFSDVLTEDDFSDDDEDEDEDNELDEAIEAINAIEGGKRALRKLKKEAEDDEELIELIEEWIEDNE